MNTPRSRPHPQVDDLSLEEKIGQLVMARYPDHDVIADALRQGQAGSFYFGMRGKSAEDVATILNGLQEEARFPAIVAFGFACTDCGSGLVAGNCMRLGAARSPELAYRLAYLETSEQRAYGFHIPGTPVLDVNVNPVNPIINTRAFSDNAELVTELGMAMLRGVLDARGVTCTMHFPGHGATDCDSHIRVPVDARPFDELWETDLLPYREAIPKGLINGVCTNHCHYPCIMPGPPQPATVARPIVTDLLRGRLGYDGVIMSDSLTMKPMLDAYGVEESAVLAVTAGHDIILQDYRTEPRITHAALLEAARNGRIPIDQIDASVRRVLALKEWLGLFEAPLVDLAQVSDRVATREHADFALKVARESVTVLEDHILPLPPQSEHTVLIANGRDVAHDIDLDIKHLPATGKLVQALQRREPAIEIHVLSKALEHSELAVAEQAARSADRVIIGLFTRVLCYHEDSIGLPPAYVALVERLVESGKPVVLLNFGNPYVMANLPVPGASICTYDEHCPESFEAATEILYGEVSSRGRLPVRVSERYPYGHGK